jgi:hypothetical protein
MMRTAQQQAVAWFTLSRGVLVHATLTSTQLKSVAHSIQSVEFDQHWSQYLSEVMITNPTVVLITTEKCVWYL